MVYGLTVPSPSHPSSERADLGRVRARLMPASHRREAAGGDVGPQPPGHGRHEAKNIRHRGMPALR